MNTLSLSFLLIALLALSACVDRTTADQKLVKACQAAIVAFSEEGDTIENINNKTIGNPQGMGQNFREVKLNVTVTDGFHGREEDHACIFREEFSFGRLSHRASIHQFDFLGRIIGQKDGRVHGGLEEMQKLTNAVDSALR